MQSVSAEEAVQTTTKSLLATKPAMADAVSTDENGEGGGAEYWLLCAVVCNGQGLFVGDNVLGDIFCMLHTSDGVCRSRTAVTGMVYSNASPVWPSNGNGNAFVLPVRHSNRKTDLVVTVWDGSESLEEAVPVGKIHVDLTDFVARTSAGATNGIKDDAPPKYEYPVELVPRLSGINGGSASLTLMLERANASFEGSGAKDAALNDLLRRLAIARKKDRLKRLMQWDREYPGPKPSAGLSQGRDYSLVALLTNEKSSPEVQDIDSRLSDEEAMPGDEEKLEFSAPVEGMVERLAEGQNGTRLAAAPVRAQAELLSRLKHLCLQNDDVLMEKGNKSTSFFYIKSGACVVIVNGEEVSRIDEGQFLGEIGVLYDSNRIADVRAIGPTELLVLSGEDLWLALDMFPGLYGELKHVAQMRIDHVKDKKMWGENRANVDIGQGALREFRAFLQSVAGEISNSLNSSPEVAHNGIDITYPNGAKGLNALKQNGSTNSSPGGVLHPIAELGDEKPIPMSLDTKQHEGVLSARLKRMELNGQFGRGGSPVAADRVGIQIPSSMSRSAEAAQPSPTGMQLASSLRGAIMPMVGSLEQARKAGGLASALSPQNSTWDIEQEDVSSSSEDSDSDSYDSAEAAEQGQLGSDSSVGSGDKNGEMNSSRKKRSSDGSNKKASKKRPTRPRKSMFRTRFRKAHDTYNSEEMGATARRVSKVTLSGLSVQSLKEVDINAYFVVEGRNGPLVSKSEVVRGDRNQNEICWQDPLTIDLEESELLWNHKLKVSIFQSRKLWSDKIVGCSLVGLQEALRRPGVPMQSTYEIVKEKAQAPSKSSEDLDSTNSSNESPRGGMPHSSSMGNLLGRLTAGSNKLQRTNSQTRMDEDDMSRQKSRGTLTLTLMASEPVKLPFSFSVPALTPGMQWFMVTDHMGVTVAKMEYVGRSRCAWCTKVDPNGVFEFDYQSAEQGPLAEPCCAACATKGWSECVNLWDKEGKIRLGQVFTDITPRKHSRARVSDQNDAHFASVRAACASKPELSVGVRFKIVSTFSELSIRPAGSIITGKTCSSSFQVYVRKPEHEQHHHRKPVVRHGDFTADINRGGLRDPAVVNVHPGKDAVRSILLAIGINEACRLRPKAMYEGVTFKDKFDRDYEREDGIMIPESPQAGQQSPLLGGSPKEFMIGSPVI